LDNLSLQLRGNYDYGSTLREQRHAATSNPTNIHANGSWDYHKYEDKLIYTDAILTYDTDLSESFNLNAVLGSSYSKSEYGVGIMVNSGNENGLIYPNEFTLQNMQGSFLTRSVTNGTVIKQGVFANLQLGYKNMLYLDLAGRNDWASTLALTENDSY